MAVCIICDNIENNQIHIFNELQLGTHEAFEYQCCNNCGSMQLLNVPNDIGKYYPNNEYYSFNFKIDITQQIKGIKKIKTEYYLFNKHRFFGFLITIGYKWQPVFKWIKNCKTKYEDSVLDVGTGNGGTLSELHNIGYKNLTGIDPFINEEIYQGNLRILRKSIFDLQQKYHTIMMHHSLEHTTNPLAVIIKAKELLEDNGTLLIRIPIMGNYSWKKYKQFWCGLDAPRHIFIPTKEAVKILAEKAGLQIVKFEYDSPDFVSILWMSEQFKNGIALNDNNSFFVNPHNSIFSKIEIKKFRKILKDEASHDNGDTAAIYLKKQSK
jgi:2-polyprenyl-3-methyl-5-hydroxy-6-metoxy-1,4-benzoquinol methylase